MEEQLTLLDVQAPVEKPAPVADRPARRPRRRQPHTALKPDQIGLDFRRRGPGRRRKGARSTKNISGTWRTISADAERSYFEQVDDIHLLAEELPTKPKTRAECASVPRPCPYISCKYNLAARISEDGIRYPSAHTGHSDADTRTAYERMDELIKSIVEGKHGTNCTLDYADKASGGAEMTPSEIGKLLGYTREMVRQIQISALAKLRASLDELGADTSIFDLD